jgi:hypothetical protein
MKNLKTKSIYQTNEDGEEENIAENIPVLEDRGIEFVKDLTEEEKINDK